MSAVTADYDELIAELPVDAREGIERLLVRAFLALRALHLLQAGVVLARGRHSYRRRPLAAASLAAATVQSAWTARRLVRDRRFTPVVGRVDTVASLIGIFTVGAATEPVHRASSVNWMQSLGVGTAVAGSMALDRREGLGSSLALAGAYGWTIRQAGPGIGTPTAGIANVLSYPGYHLLSRALAGLLLTNAEDLDQARRAAVERGERLAAERERNRQHRLLHDAALQTLEAVASGWADDDNADAVARMAGQDAARLRSALSGTDVEPAGLTAALEDLRARWARQGLHVELLTAELRGELAPAAAEAISSAAGEALANVARHAEVRRAVMRASTSSGGVEVTVRDHGVGFDPERREAGFGTRQSIRGRVEEVGGQVEIWSAPGRGTRVKLWVPG